MCGGLDVPPPALRFPLKTCGNDPIRSVGVKILEMPDRKERYSICSIIS